MSTRAGSEPGWGFGFRPGAGIALGPIGRRLNGRGRWRFFAGIWLLYLLPGFASAWTDHSGADRVLRLALLVAFCYVYVDLVARALTGARPWLRWAAPALLAALSLALAALVGPDSLGTVVYVTVAVVVLQPFRLGVPIAAAGTLLVGLSSWIVPSWAGSDTWAVAGSVALGSLAAFGFQALIRRTWELRAAQQEVSRLAAERERMRIARDLHDAAGHGVTAISLQAATGLKMIDEDGDIDEARAVLEEIKRTSRIALEDMRKLLGLLRPSDTADPERDRVSLSHLDDMISECRAAGLTVIVEREGNPVDLPPILDQTAYRIIQEALTNVLKHAGPGATARVRVGLDPTSVELEVTDDGPGTVGDVGVGTRRGLIGMRERVELFGGRFSAGPIEGGGFRVFARLPLGNPLENVSRR